MQSNRRYAGARSSVPSTPPRSGSGGGAAGVVADDMPAEQRRRFDRLSTERHYLLDVDAGAPDARATDPIRFNVSGSTGNVYTVTMVGTTRQFHCTCPDFTSHARGQHVECKHICFVVWRVLLSSLPPGHWTQNDRIVPFPLWAQWKTTARRIRRHLTTDHAVAVSSRTAVHDTRSAARGGGENDDDDVVVVAETNDTLVPNVLHPEYRQRFLRMRERSAAAATTNSRSAGRVAAPAQVVDLDEDGTTDAGPAAAQSEGASAAVPLPMQERLAEAQAQARQRVRDEACIVDTGVFASGLRVSASAPVPADGDGVDEGGTAAADEDETNPPCYVCFDVLCDEQRSADLVACPTCMHALHRDCADAWTRNHSTCVFCRSPLPYVTTTAQYRRWASDGGSSVVPPLSLEQCVDKHVAFAFREEQGRLSHREKGKLVFFGRNAGHKRSFGTLQNPVIVGEEDEQPEEEPEEEQQQQDQEQDDNDDNEAVVPVYLNLGVPPSPPSSTLHARAVSEFLRLRRHRSPTSGSHGPPVP